MLNAFKKMETERGWKEDIERDRRWQWSRYRRVSRIYIRLGKNFIGGGDEGVDSRSSTPSRQRYAANFIFTSAHIFRLLLPPAPSPPPSSVSGFDHPWPPLAPVRLSLARDSLLPVIFLICPARATTNLYRPSPPSPPLPCTWGKGEMKTLKRFNRGPRGAPYTGDDFSSSRKIRFTFVYLYLRRLSAK